MRYLLLDRITSLERERATAIKCVSLADDVFVDHFPGYPVPPGTLIIEALAQLGGVLAEAAMRAEGCALPHIIGRSLRALAHSALVNAFAFGGANVSLVVSAA